MGKGKGKHDHWVAPTKGGNPLLEVFGNIPEKTIKKAYKRINYRLPIYTKLILPKKQKNIIYEYSNH